jgi:hypothetical protein
LAIGSSPLAFVFLGALKEPIFKLQCKLQRAEKQLASGIWQLAFVSLAAFIGSILKLQKYKARRVPSPARVPVPHRRARRRRGHSARKAASN